jgi:putative Mg2+ transporter-C (MgtC) family protein
LKQAAGRLLLSGIGRRNNSLARIGNSAAAAQGHGMERPRQARRLHGLRKRGAIMVLDFDDIAIRLGAAALAGVLIGINRDMQNKPIGARTLGLVALGTALVAVSGIQYPGMAENPDAASRVVQGIIQGVMTGVSFIGAGVILRDAKTKTVEGLTTAATVWVTAAAGIACGLGAWRSVAVAMPVALVLLVVVPWVEAKWADKSHME